VLNAVVARLVLDHERSARGGDRAVEATAEVSAIDQGDSRELC
jgi:hypothetical protein